MVDTEAGPHLADIVILSGNTDGNATTDIPFDLNLKSCMDMSEATIWLKGWS